MKPNTCTGTTSTRTAIFALVAMILTVLAIAPAAAFAAGPPTVSGVSVSEVLYTEATLQATIDPEEAATEYHFQYTTLTDYEANGFANATNIPVPDASAGQGTEGVKVSQAITGLQPDTAYRYRLVAKNTAGTTESPAKPFRTYQQSASTGVFPGQGFLPDDRAWEMVSPQDKNGGDVMISSLHTRAAADGSAISFTSLTAFGDAAGTGIATEYAATRSSDANPGNSGWATHAITPPQASVPLELKFAAVDAFYQGEFSPNLEAGVFNAPSPLTNDASVANVDNLYLRTNLRTGGAGNYQLLTSCPLCEATSTPLPAVPPTNRESATFVRWLQPHFAGASPDMRHVIFESRRNLTSDAPPQPTEPPACNPTGWPYFLFCRARLYEWDEGTLRLAGRVPVAPATSCNDANGPACVGSDVAFAGQGVTKTRPHDISDGSDGHTRVFFTQPTDEEGHTSSEVSGFAQIAINQSGEGNSDASGKLYMRVDHAVTEQLNVSEGSEPSTFSPASFVDASTSGERVFFSTRQALTDDAAGPSEKLYMYDASKPGSDPHNLTLISSDLAGFVGASADGRYVYFTDGSPYDGKVYLWHEGRLTIVSEVHPGEEGEDWMPGVFSFVVVPRQARVSPDGKHLLFVSYGGQGLLSAHGGEDYDQGACTNKGCRELYLYNTDTNTLQCASCNPQGSPAKANATTTVMVEAESGMPGTWHENHALSADGRYVFFSTAEPLVPNDINGIEDAYEFDSQTGEVHLLSSGESDRPSYFLDASADGEDAFIMTAEPLSHWDTDNLIDLYDARIAGGFPEPPAPPPSCQGDACQPASAQVFDPSLASASFSGPGNPVAVKPAVKHRAKRKVKTRKPRHTRRQHARHHAGHHNRGAHR